MKHTRTAAMMLCLLLTLIITTTASALEPRLRPLDFSQQVSPNSDGQVEGDTELFFNWGVFRTGLRYKSETIVENYVDADQDTFVNQQSKTYDLVLLKTKTGFIGNNAFSINPFIGTKLVVRTEKRIGEDTGAGFWFTEESEDKFVNFYGSADIKINTRAIDISLTAGGGYILKSTDGEFRNSDPAPDLNYTSSDRGFNFFSTANLMLKFSPKFYLGLTFSYNREASYYERYYIAEARRDNYAYYIHEFSYGAHIYLNFLKKALNGVPFIGVTYIDYRREIQTGNKEKFENKRFKFDVGVKL